MQEVVEEQQEQTVFRPYNFFPSLGECADGNLNNVSKYAYGENFAFRLAGRLVVKHAP